MGWHDGASDIKISYLKKFAQGKTALDLGCGAGWYSDFLSKNGFDVTSVDLHPAPGIKAIQCDLNKDWPVEGKKFDVVIAFDVVEHVREEEKLLRNISNACSSTLFFSVPQTDPGIFKDFNLTYFHYTDRTHERTYTASEIKEKLSRFGFEIISIQPEGPVMPHVISVFARSKFFGWVLRKTVSVLLRLGILHLPYYADLFVVAKRKSL